MCIPGYQDLSYEDKVIFKSFLKRYSTYSNKRPIAVKAIKDKYNGKYLKVYFSDMWLHVKRFGAWY